MNRWLHLIVWGLFAATWLAGGNASAQESCELVVVSKAGEPLDGHIALIGVERLRWQDISVALGSKEDFRNLGLERFGYLETLRFEVTSTHVRVSSPAPIADPYLNFLVRLAWPGGTTMRECDVLLDAPGPTAAQSPPAIPAEQPEVTPAPTEWTVTVQPPVGPTERTVTVQPNQTLWSIAAANLPDGTNVQQQMLAILQENPHAFVGDNINGLVAGATLRLPSGAAATSMSPQEAIDEAGRQNDAWGAGGGGQLRIIDPAEDGPAAEAVTEPPTPETVAEPPRDAIAIVDPPPEPPLADLLQEARRQVREQARQLQRRDDEIARLTNELAALQASRRQERQDWMEALGRWRIAALAGLFPTAGLVAIGLVALRRRQVARRADASDAPDYDFGAPIGDGRVKLNLAKAHIDLDDRASARELLEEVIAGGTDQERSEAQALLERLAEQPSQPAQS
ncbi:MAG: hypothetical protein F4229_04830 [Gammaproteobacteria bacterium]|nr:hypothetical protein [Gammaproteobacteria bacterium]